MKTLTEAQVLKLRPGFKLSKGGMTTIEWFEINKGSEYYGIRSGLQHADGETESPYAFSETKVGRGAQKKCLESFTAWWEYVNSEPYNTVTTFPTKYKLGFTSDEIDEVCNTLGVLRKDYNEKFGVNTCSIIDDQTIYYHSDVTRTFRLVMENREMRVEEWD